MGKKNNNILLVYANVRLPAISCVYSYLLHTFKRTIFELVHENEKKNGAQKPGG